MTATLPSPVPTPASPASGRILIITSGQLCRNPRVLKEATTLSDIGYAVTVLTIANIPRFERFDEDLLAGARFNKVVVDHVSRALGARLRAFVDRGLTWLSRKLITLGWEKPSALGPYASLLRLARRYPADLTIVHTELPLCVGMQLLAEGRKVAADYEDWHSEDLLTEAQRGRPLQLLRRVEEGLLAGGVYASTTSQAMAAALSERYRAPMPVVIRNTFPIPAAHSALEPAREPSFFWFSQTIGPGRGLEGFLAAWAEMRESTTVCLLGDVDRSFQEFLLHLLPETRRASLRFLPITSPDALPSVIARFDIGLALEPNEPANKDLTISNKIFQYLNAGLAVVATATTGQREVLSVAPEAGIVVDLAHREHLGAQLDALVRDRVRLAAMKQAARRAAVEHFSWDHDAARLLAAVRAAVASGPHRA